MNLVFAFVLFVVVHAVDPIFDGNQAYAVNGDGCILLVPDQPLTPLGLMTPYQLMGPNCDEANPGNARFVHAVILNTVQGTLSVYNPLVITAGTKCVAPPTPINFVAADNVVGIWLGSNSNFLVLGNDAGVANGRCVTGPQGSPFGQFAWCNSDRFWEAANLLIQQGKIRVPALGTAVDGFPCPTLRDFFVIDMDPDDGVQSLYGVTAQKNVVQLTAANKAKFQITNTLANDGDNRLVTKFVNAAIGCQTIQAPDLADPGAMTECLPLNIIQAMQLQNPPMVLTPNNDPMITTNNMPDLLKLNLYRLGVSQPQATALGGDNDPTTYCRNYAFIAPQRFRSLATALKNFASPAPDTPNLFQFMKNRAMTTYLALNCAGLTGIPDPFAALQ